MLPKRRPGQCLRFAGGQEGGLSPGQIGPTAPRPTQPRPPSPPRRAPPRPDRPVVCPGFGFDRWYESPDVSSPDMPCMENGFTETMWRRRPGQQAGTKSGRRPVDNSVVNRGSTGCPPLCFVSPSVYTGIRLFVLPEIAKEGCLRLSGG